MSIVNQLRDACFISASNGLKEVIVEFKREVGRKPTLAELCEILTWGARSFEDELLEGTPSFNITIEGRAVVPKQRLSEGDLVAVPVGRERVAMILYICQCGRFGKAFGLFDGSLPPWRSIQKWQPSGQWIHPVFCDDRLVKMGRWKVVANRPDLVKRFRAPEVYHHPKYDPGDGSYGRHGLAESPGGTVRKLSAAEAREVFADVPGMKGQFFIADALETFLTDRNE
ncbi:MAG: hypothetical protein HY901_38530 [Deltaproteobacteria bacterium]|nr:hypothetical protein [Deltaproteobacteria bacterium]